MDVISGTQEWEGRGMRQVEAQMLPDLVTEMGQRLQAQYLDGAIPYLREAEPELWATLMALDEDDSPATLQAYERLFLEGLARFQASRCRIAA